jgi:arginine/lysine/ornithine decarboxylase
MNPSEIQSESQTGEEKGLFETLVDLKHLSQVSFHVPGNKFGRDLTPVLEKNGLSFEALDYTEVAGTDNLHAPEGAIKAAQNKAAKAFGARETQFLVGGTTAGILAAVLGTVPRGHKLILPRDAHRSVHSAILLGGIVPVYVMPQLDMATGVSLGMSVERALEAIISNPDASAVLVTYPTYEGIACDLGRIIEAAHNHDMLVIADEAHAAHFDASEDLPPSALSLGADLSAQSTHKTLTSLTQSSMLHYGTEKGMAAKPRVSSYLAMIQSSSPSYPLMVSLELATELFILESASRMKILIDRIDHLWNKIRPLGFESLVDSIELPQGLRVDVTRIALRGCGIGFDGYALQEALETYGILCEYATPTHVLLIPSMASTENDFDCLLSALESIAAGAANSVLRKAGAAKAFRVPVTFIRMISAEEALWHEKESVGIEHAAGRIAGEFLVPYPPGIPLVAPGEVVTEEIICIIREELGIKHKINGLHDGKILVVKQSEI